MEKRMLWLGLMLMVIGLCSSGAFATTMGSPVAGLETGQFSIGLEYSTSDTTLELDGGEDLYAELVIAEVVVDSIEMEIDYDKAEVDFESDMIFANFGYGVSDKLEVFVRLGMADLSADNFSGGNEFAYGLGAKATFYEEADLKLGALLQITWASSEGDLTNDEIEELDPVDIPLEANWYELKLAVGPSYELTEGCSIYGGPFYHLISGDIEGDDAGEIDISGIGTVNYDYSVSADIEAVSNIGGYIGAQIDFAENLPFFVEYQITGDADILGLSLVYRF